MGQEVLIVLRYNGVACKIKTRQLLSMILTQLVYQESIAFRTRCLETNSTNLSVKWIK